MKKIYAIFAAIAVCMTSCNLMDDVFDWSDVKEDKEFSSEIWTSIQRNVVTVELHEWGTETVTLPESGAVSIIPDYSKGKASLLFKSFTIVDPEKKPDDWSFDKGVTWIRKALYVYLFIDTVPFKVSDDGVIQFSKKTVNGTLTYGDMSGDEVDISNKRKDCKVSIAGEMTQNGAIGRIRNGVPMIGSLSIKIITPDGERLLLGYTQLDPGSTNGFNEIFR